HLARTPQDRAVRHPFHRRSGVPRRPRAGHDAATGPDRRPVERRFPPPAQPRSDDHRGVRRPCAAHPRRSRCRRSAPMSTAVRNFILRILLILGVLAVWELVVRAFAVPAFILPAPSSVFTALYRGIASAIYLDHLWVTLAETLLGFMLGSALAFA